MWFLKVKKYLNVVKTLANVFLYFLVIRSKLLEKFFPTKVKNIDFLSLRSHWMNFFETL